MMQKPPNIKNFEILKCIGRGGMSTVWEARQVSLDRRVAIKVLDPGMAADPDDVERFYEEARAAGKLLHPGIVQVYDVGFSDGRYYFVMERVDGYTIGDWVRRNGRLPEKEILAVGEGVATALDYAWREFGVVHCDVKPDNVMIDADGTVKVTDLGLARTIFSLREEVGSEEIAGTPAYMSPEQVRGDIALDCRSDIYALGAMFYHLATGRMLFEGRECFEIMESQRRDRAPDAQEIVKDLSPGFCALVEKMLAKSPAHRPRDWRRVLAELRRVAKGQFPEHLLGPGLSTMKRGPARRAAMTRHAARMAPPPARRKKPSNAFPLAALITALVLVLAGVTALWGMRGQEQKLRAASRRRRERLRIDPAARSREVDLALAKAAETRYASAEQWERDHPGRPRSAARLYRQVAELYPGTASAARALARAEALETAPRGGPESVKAALDQAARTLLEEGKIEAAQAVYADYAGAFADEIRGWRRSRARALWEASQRERAPEPPGPDLPAENAAKGAF